ncbi:MAG: bifunctional (p)ppGpp synthetase/guanosine-3',5'-bis(diphosphate) 3'-pyrophosphohydrolase [Bacteroidaceae bacterium]|nr:bifunctional (p)ppGpp synthetase/guanosine-3',5'-bis(diphosphate) 3'-pyrophosphohydrolase [Bacteroidaceae bacterium]
MNTEKELAEEKMINEAFQGMLSTYLASKHRKKVDIITRAFNFAKHAHKGVRRNSGEPYIMHPIAVARIVSEEIGLGSTSICAALLHDVVEDTEYTVEDIANLFGPKIAQIVDGLTKIAGGIFGDKASAQTENFKKLLLTMSEDIRVILIKIADRLHNMRTLEHMAPNKQYKIAGETLYIYAPIAYRLGLSKIKVELENLSFKYEHPEEYARIEEKLAITQAEREKLFADFTAPIKDKLDEMGVQYTLSGRIKSPYSIWKKMQNKHLAFDEIFDILAVRIIFEPKNIKEEANECFNIYIALSQLYRTHPDRFRDWVNQPKTNGYQALHVTLMSNHGEWVEVQIRSQRMNDIAEQGVAAHWKYKENGYVEEDEVDLNKWLHTIKEILDDPQPDAMDFLDAIKLNLYSSEIFVFTPKGDIKTMPQGCTALDFAFSIHTVLGTHCIGAKVNHKLVPMSHVLQSGDQVEVLTSKTQNVKPEWLSMATTAKAKSKIQGILRREERNAHKEGEHLMDEFVQREGLTLDVHNTARLCRLHNFTEYEQLLVAIGKGTVILGDAERNAIKGTSSSTNILGRLFRTSKKEQPLNEAMPLPSNTTQKIDKKRPLILTDESLQSSYHMANCCHPIPGDDVLGFIDGDGQIVIHQRKCPEAAKLKAAYGNRIVAAQWSTHKLLHFSVSINIKGIDGVGVVNQITNVISQELNVNMERILIEAYDGIFDGTIRLRVHDVDDIKVICDNLKKLNNIRSVVRVDN